ncbi:hypothetical protein CLV47_101327 [Antricoccus suffuscus]|uniref:DUF6285 domain-containing protein n=1 Tax=Antricoccus suffuscus TaxID=1629062 RepID=A0A2T1A6G3_9ACTN|nr:DUF6285 domain-containing protein [Antricoccus suffuscus]PRZ44202.1 hypothetical protein CLV47_101327 [Antricoccus suffuscus]
MNLHGRPTTAELASAVQEFLRDEIMPALDGRLRFHTLVAANVLAIIERELTLGPDQQAEHEARLAEFDVSDDVKLAAAIRSGALDGRSAEVVEALWESVVAKVTVANPKYLATPA